MIDSRRRRSLVVALLASWTLMAGCEPESSDPPASTPILISSQGAGCVRIGDAEDRVRAACDVVADTVLLMEGMEQDALRVREGGADVLVELVEGRVWRISVLGAGPLTSDSLGVGTPFPRAAERLELDIHAGEGRYFAVPREPCGLSFELAGVPFEGAPPSVESLLQRGDDVHLSRVLVVGCPPTPR